MDVFYREAGPPDAPVVLLPHGYPSLLALGRQELWEDSPRGYPQTKSYDWWPWHDTLETGPDG
ncbi:hypothetical protein [Sphingopyxis sp.]|uniref:hypothetical protein n=1 Tax=Sphingopyxis sp. TaxID=1908224 RepID=UPI002ED8EE4C